MKKTQFGFSLIELLIVVVIMGIIAAIAIPNLMAARRNANEASATSSMRSIISAEVTYRSTVGSGNFGVMISLINGGLIDASFNESSRSGYVFTVTKADQSAGQPPIFDASAVPVKHGIHNGSSGTRSFYSNEAGVIYYNYINTAPFATSNLDRTINDGAPINN